ncbi:dTDP-4-dehydrorhamnose reductase [Cellvibrio japonicus]|uniref:dTDP-4-dehydrorhamnose reductase n=1 Tax=Cellvibrio japonicus (strain Ueda107) TaxID=498211 RepID=B3PFY3_CELJU|nr:dTDP-4-dehydrorhamnose reductase [Cellvibrio japonicus]ACE83423.1 dTDP-4-dehydrorhamnose reductase [Cellvibrio japonicus Ueda107]QEI13672.1 dTDP-4-dehydrorhamnose reductase [Cellvibrio japonicus]QEI17246.1 dTDP-4-dehydrorhamnose reductase [Cellvibrio japonicus]QEI20823.1 dTDP-4-dehydrorhamnose reductase [Cellvibrio japonicus]
MKILVTGANGQVGHCLHQQLINNSMSFKAVTRKQLDITDVSAVERSLKEYQPNIVINAAAYTAVDKAESDQENAFRINRDGVANLASVSSAIGAAIFHISTDYVFAGNNDHPYREDDDTSPQGIYGQSKLAGEIAVIQTNPKHIILRTAWVFGEHGNNFVKTMIRLGRTRDSLGIVADQHGGPTHAGDIATALIRIAHQYIKTGDLPWGTYHYAGMPHTNWYEFARAIFKQVEAENLYDKATPSLNAIATADYPTPAKRPANSRLDCTKIQTNFGIAPSDWQAALNNIKAYAG